MASIQFNVVVDIKRSPLGPSFLLSWKNQFGQSTIAFVADVLQQPGRTHLCMVMCFTMVDIK
jgi:hypothetical protein